MRIPITVKVDSDRKILYESMKTIHGKTFTDALEDGIDNILKDTTPAAVIELEITRIEQNLIKLRQDLIKAKSVQLATDIAQSKLITIDKHTEQMRVDKLVENQRSLVVQWKKSNINWKGFMNAYHFDNTAEAKKWLQTKLVEYDLI